MSRGDVAFCNQGLNEKDMFNCSLSNPLEPLLAPLEEIPVGPLLIDQPDQSSNLPM